MSGYVTHLSKQTIRLFLLLVFVVSGCRSPDTFYRIYDGPELPLEEVAVILEQDFPCVWVKRIDNTRISRSWVDFDLFGLGAEIDIAPGKHDVELFYHGRYYESVGTIELSDYFEKGHVYQYESTVDPGRTPGFFSERYGPPTWQAHRKHLGTVQEVALCRCKGANALICPSRWLECAKRQSPSAPKDEQ